MIALLRYLAIKGVRERYVQMLLAGPAVLSVMPLLVTAMYNVGRGQEVWPLTLGWGMKPEVSASMLAIVALVCSVIIASIAAFWVFRSEMTGHTIGFFILAQPRSTPPLSAIVAASALGAGSYLITIPVLGLLTGSLLTTGWDIAPAALCGILLAASLTTFLVGLSAEVHVLTPAIVIAVTAVTSILKFGSLRLTLATAALAIGFALGAPLTWRRRWAA